MPVFCLICAAGEHPCKIQPVTCGRIILFTDTFQVGALLRPPSLCSLKGLNLLQMCGFGFCEVAEGCFSLFLYFERSYL